MVVIKGTGMDALRISAYLKSCGLTHDVDFKYRLCHHTYGDVAAIELTCNNKRFETITALKFSQ
jgi:hypothetical protein